MSVNINKFQFHLSDEDLLQKLRCAAGLNARLAVDSEKDQARAEEVASENEIDVLVIVRARARRVG